MGNKKRKGIRKVKNRGGERLIEWRTIKSCGLIRNRPNPSSSETGDVVITSEDNDTSTECDTDVQPPELVVEVDSGVPETDCGTVLTGRRIVDIAFFFSTV